MERESAANGRNTNRQETRLRDRQPSGLRHRRVSRIVVIRDNHIASIVAPEQKNADQSLVIPSLGERLKQTETLKGQSCRPKCTERPPQKFSACHCHVCLLS